MHVSARHGQAKCKCCTIPYASVWKITPNSAINWIFDTGADCNWMAVDGSGNLYIASTWSSTYSANLFCIDPSGALVWSAQVGSSSTSTGACYYDGSQLIVTGTDSGYSPVHKLFYVNASTGATTSSYSVLSAAPDYVSYYTDFAYDATLGLFASNATLTIGGTGGGSLSAGTYTRFSLGTNSCDAVCINPFAANSVLYGRNQSPDKGIAPMDATTLIVGGFAAGANSETGRLVPDLTQGAGSEIVWACGIGLLRKITNGATLVPAWRYASLGYYAAYPDSAGGAFACGRNPGASSSSNTVGQIDSSGSKTWGWTGTTSGLGQTGVYYDGTSVFTCGPRNNTYATTA